MAETDKYKELVQKAAELQEAVDASQAREATQDQADKDTIAGLNTQIAALQAIIDAGTGNTTTDDQLQAVVDSLTATKNDIEGA